MNRTKLKKLILALAAAPMMLFGTVQSFGVILPVLGTAQDFAVLGHTTVTNTGPTVIFGSADTIANTGVFQAGGANATTGFSTAGNTFAGPGSNTDGPGIVVAPAAVHNGSAVADLARNDLINAYVALATYGTATNLTGQILGDGVGGVVPVLGPGVYSFASTAQLNGTLQLDAGGIDGGVWIFQIGTDLTTASASAVELINPGGNLGSDVGVYWVIGVSGTPGLGSATLGTGTAFEGNILALASITLNNAATIYNGRALARNGAVTLDTNTISNICPPESTSPNSGPGFSGGLGFDSDTGQLVPVTIIPEPGTTLLAACGLAILLIRQSRRPAGFMRPRLIVATASSRT